MKVLLTHNKYQHQGGEDVVVENELQLLKDCGVDAQAYIRDNEEINTYGIADKMNLFLESAWSDKSRREFREVLLREKPDIVHSHNFFPLLSPSIFAACKELGIPVVQSLHNYRLGCLNGIFVRNNQVCEKCISGNFLPGIIHKCYRDSHVQSLAVARMNILNKRKDTWNSMVDRFFCFTDFAKGKFVSMGIDERKIIVKPNFVSLPNLYHKKNAKTSFLYVGRLDESKGIQVFLEAANLNPELEFHMAGKNTNGTNLDAFKNVKYHGQVSREQVYQLIQENHFLIFPSLCYEGMPMTILEAFALKTPVIASDLGAMQSLVNSGDDGFLFKPGSAQALSDQIREVLHLDKKQLDQLTDKAFQKYEADYSEEANKNILLNCYEELISQR